MPEAGACGAVAHCRDGHVDRHDDGREAGLLGASEQLGRCGTTVLKIELEPLTAQLGREVLEGRSRQGAHDHRRVERGGGLRGCKLARCMHKLLVRNRCEQ